MDSRMPVRAGAPPMDPIFRSFYVIGRDGLHGR